MPAGHRWPSDLESSAAQTHASPNPLSTSAPLLAAARCTIKADKTMKASRASECNRRIESHGKTASATDFLITRVIRNRATNLCGRVALFPSFWGHRSTNLADRAMGACSHLGYPQVGRRLGLSTCPQCGVLPLSGACLACWHPFTKTGTLKGWASWTWTPGYRWAHC